MGAELDADWLGYALNEVGNAISAGFRGKLDEGPVTTESQSGNGSPKTVSAAARKYTGPKHHIATDKHDLFTPILIKNFEAAGLNIHKSRYILMRLTPHQGPHGEGYHELVMFRLAAAWDRGMPSGQKAIRREVIRELKLLRREIRKNPRLINLEH